MRGVHLTLRQALRLYELAKVAGDTDLCGVADKVIGPKTCDDCGIISEGVIHLKSIPARKICRSCYKKCRS